MGLKTQGLAVSVSGPLPLMGPEKAPTLIVNGEPQKVHDLSDEDYLLDLAEEFAIRGDAARSNLFLELACDAAERYQK